MDNMTKNGRKEASFLEVIMALATLTYNCCHNFSLPPWEPNGLCDPKSCLDVIHTGVIKLKSKNRGG